jgi:hypothetical protein
MRESQNSVQNESTAIIRLSRGKTVPLDSSGIRSAGADKRMTGRDEGFNDQPSQSQA